MSESDTSTSRLVIDESVNESRVERYEEGKKILAELGLKIRPTSDNLKIKAKKAKMERAKKEKAKKEKEEEAKLQKSDNTPKKPIGRPRKSQMKSEEEEAKLQSDNTPRRSRGRPKKKSEMKSKIEKELNTESCDEGSENPHTYDVEDILTREKRGNKWFYMIKWENYDEPSWEPEENLSGCKEELQAFHKKVEKNEKVVNCPAESTFSERILAQIQQVDKHDQDHSIELENSKNKPSDERRNDCDNTNLLGSTSCMLEKYIPGTVVSQYFPSVPFLTVSNVELETEEECKEQIQKSFDEMTLEEKVAFIEGMENMTVDRLKSIDWNDFHKISEKDITAGKIDELIEIYNDMDNMLEDPSSIDVEKHENEMFLLEHKIEVLKCKFKKKKAVAAAEIQALLENL